MDFKKLDVGEASSWFLGAGAGIVVGALVYGIPGLIVLSGIGGFIGLSEYMLLKGKGGVLPAAGWAICSISAGFLGLVLGGDYGGGVAALLGVALCPTLGVESFIKLAIGSMSGIVLGSFLGAVLGSYTCGELCSFVLSSALVGVLGGAGIYIWRDSLPACITWGVVFSAMFMFADYRLALKGLDLSSIGVLMGAGLFTGCALYRVYRKLTPMLKLRRS